MFLARHDADAAPKAEIANKAETDFAPGLMRFRQVKARALVTPENIQALCVFARWNSFYKCETHPCGGWGGGGLMPKPDSELFSIIML